VNQYLYLDESGRAALVNQEPDQRRLTMFQTLVDGSIDIASAVPRCRAGFAVDAIINDEGLYRPDFSINLVATWLTGRQLVGPVVLSCVSRNGDSIGLNASQIARLRRDGLEIDDNDGQGYTAAQIIDNRAGY